MKLKNIVFYLLYLFVFSSLCYGVYINNYRTMFICMFTLFLFLLVDFIIKSFNLKISFSLKILIFLFLLCSEILGEVFNFYSIVTCWDDILHFVFGCIVSYLSYLFFNKYIRIINFSTILVCMIFSFCFSLSFGVIWEFIEFSFDKHLESDMQKDTLLKNYDTSYFGSTDSLTHINSIVKTEIYTNNGVILVDGYLDIGLSDTMTDLFVDCLGALFTSLIIGYYLTKKLTIGLSFRL